MSVVQDFDLPKDVIFPPGDLESNEPKRNNVPIA